MSSDSRPRLTRVLVAAALLAGLIPACGAAPDPDTGPAGGAGAAHAVILLYHHVASDTPPSTSVTPQTFRAHLQYLERHGYTVVPLSRVMAAVTGDAQLPERAVAITFDDAYASVYTEAAPELERRGYPFAVFVSTHYLDQGLANYMTWDELRELERRGAEVGNHSRTHGHYVYRPPSESVGQWRRRIRTDIEGAWTRLAEELQAPLKALAYPYGEYRPDLTALAADLGYVAFGQQSGPVGAESDPQALPRFPMASGYADLESLAEKLRTRPFRASVLAPDDAVLTAGSPPPTLRLTLTAPDARLDALSCFVTGQSAPDVTWVDHDEGTVEVTAVHALPAGRSKYTCTAPSRSVDGAYYWYSHLWMKPPAPGEWYTD